MNKKVENNEELEEEEQVESGVKKKNILRNTKAQKVITLRNKFFYLGYRNSLLIFLVSGIMLCLSLFFVYIFSRQPVAPLYIPLKPDGTYIDLIRVDKEHKNDQEIADFIAKGVRKLYTRDYVNYTDQLMDASYYFTVSGWNSYLESLQKQKTMDAIKQNQWVVSFMPTAAPTLLEKKVNSSGYYTWAYEYSGIINYMGNGSRQQSVKLQILVQRTSVVDSPQGMGISLLVPLEQK